MREYSKAPTDFNGLQPSRLGLWSILVLTREGYLQSGDILISSWSGISVASKENRDYSWLRWFSQSLRMDGSALSFDWSADGPILLYEIYTNWYNIINRGCVFWITSLTRAFVFHGIKSGYSMRMGSPRCIPWALQSMKRGLLSIISSWSPHSGAGRRVYSCGFGSQVYQWPNALDPQHGKQWFSILFPSYYHHQ